MELLGGGVGRVHVGKELWTAASLFIIEGEEFKPPSEAIGGEEMKGDRGNGGSKSLLARWNMRTLQVSPLYYPHVFSKFTKLMNVFPTS